MQSQAPTIIGESTALATALDHISRLAGIDRPVLVIGERMERQVALPDFVGLSFLEAMERIEEAELLPGRMRWSALPSDGQDTALAVISSQLPEYVPGRRVRAGSEIDFDVRLPEGVDAAGGDDTLFE